MDPCHSVSSRSPAFTSAVTVAHLIRNIEQLKNKDKLISQLEKDLGHQWVAAQLAALERESVEGAQAPATGASSTPLGALPGDSYDPTNPFTWTPTSTPTTGSVEEARFTSVEGYTPGKHDLPQKLKDCKAKNKELVEKCRAYLQRTKELTAQNRAYKDSSEKVLQENKKMQELLEHSKLRVLQLTRQLNEAHAEKTNFERQTEREDELRKEMMEDKKTISALKKACSEKDRRIELIQHRKKRRRMMGSAEKNMGVKETFFGYDEDTKSVDSENSFSSMSHSTLSDEDVWDEVLSREETERNYQRLMMEHLQLQKSHAQLQHQSEHLQDPQREALTKMSLQNDLFNAQCRIEKLEKLINEIGEGEVITLLKERESIISANKEFLEKAQFWENESRRMQQELNKAVERSEDLEFQLMEMEHADDGDESSTCEDTTHPSIVDHELIEKLEDIHCLQLEAVLDMEQLRKELVALLKGKGREGDAALKKLDKLTEDQKGHANSLESMAHELQMKVISLQKEKDVLQDKLSQKGYKPGKGESAASLAAAREKQENMELKTEVARLSKSESKLLTERLHLNEALEDWKAQYEGLKQQLDILTQTQQQQKHQSSLKIDTSGGYSSGGSSSSPPSSSQLTRKASKDRKSKPRSGDDPTQTKRRRSSKDAPTSDIGHSGLKSFRSVGDIKSGSDQQSLMRSFKSIEDVQAMTERLDEMQGLKEKLRATESQLQLLNDENFNLRDQLKQCAIEKSSEAEADQQLLLDRVEALESEVDLLRRENEALAQRLRQRMEELHDSSPDELSPRLTELEDYCEDLQERLRASENAERQAREKLKLVELSIDDAESNELAVREKYEELLRRESEAKKQINALQKTGRELKDIVLDKDIVETALRDKVDFLQKAEALSVKRIEELEVIEKDLREQLEQRADPKELCLREQNKIQELKHQITFLETDNKALSARVSELEENEETLRDNWRRVADEDYNRTQCLEEKVKMLETLNRDLKAKLTDAQEYFVINTVPSTENSLADELALSQSSTRRSAAAYEGHDDEEDDDDDKDDDSVDGKEGGGEEEDGSGSPRSKSQKDPERKVLKEKLWKLERKMSDVAEEKNAKIESLQEKIVSMKENEIKLTETIAEQEMTERELRAKLALYESSEVTVEKMLKYQSKIEELRTSQESLLDQLEIMESQEMTMQEQLQETERTLRGKIVTLEVEMKGYKQKELRNAARIRELEKQEKELSEKVAQQAEKENGLYIKISSLMDELKAAKEELESVKTRSADNDDKVRKAKLMEVRMLETEMEHGKKLNDLNTKLRHKEEELRHKDSSHREEMISLQGDFSSRVAEKNQRIAILEKMFAQKERELQSTIATMKANLKELTSERDEYENQIKDLTDSNTEIREKDSVYERELDILRQEVSSIKTTEKEYEDKIAVLEESVTKERQRAEEAEAKVASLEKELAKEKGYVLEVEEKIIGLKGDIGEKMKNIESSFVEKESEYEKERQSLQEEISFKDERVRELEKELGDRMNRVRELESECEKLKSKAATSANETSEKTEELRKLLAEKDERLKEVETSLSEKESEFEEQMRSWEAEFETLQTEVSERNKQIEELKASNEKKEREYKEKLSSMKAEQEALEKELRNKVAFLNTQLLQEVESREKDQSTHQQSEDREKTLSQEVRGLEKEVEKHRLELIEKLSELEAKNKENCELSLELSNLRHSNKALQIELDNFKDMNKESERKYQEQISERDQRLEKLRQNLVEAYEEVEQFKLELSQSENKIKEVSSEKEKFVQEKQREIEKLVEEKTQKEVFVQEHIQKSEAMLQQSKQDKQGSQVELERIKKELNEKEVLLQEQLEDKNEMSTEIQDLLSQIQTLEKNLAEVTQKLEDKAAEAEQSLQKLEAEKETSVSEVKLLQKQLEEKHKEIAKKSTEHSDTQSLISAKQQELEQARTELQKCLQEIEQYKTSVQERENELHQQNHIYKEISEKHEGLNQQYQERDQVYKQMESKVTEVEHKLLQAENRYRELEAKCASLEMQLEERFSQAQEAEKVIRKKEEECQQLAAKLGTVEKEHEDTCAQFQEAEQIIRMKKQEYEQLESKLETIERECEQMKVSLTQKEKNHEETVAKLTAMHQEVSKSQTEKQDSQSEVRGLQEKIASLEKQCEDATSQLHAAEEKSQETIATLQSNMQSLEKKFSEVEQKLKSSEQCVRKLEVSKKEQDTVIEKLRSDLKDGELQHSETQSNLKKTESDLKIKSTQYDTLKDRQANAEQDLNKSEEKCDKLKETLSSTEDRLLLNSQNISELTSKITILEKALEEKESVYRDSKSGLDSIEQKHRETQMECENLKSRLTYLQQVLLNTQKSSEENEQKLEEIEQALQQTKKELSDTQDKLSEKETSHSEILSKFEHSQTCLNSSQEEVKNYVEKMTVLEKRLEDVLEENKDLEVNCDRLLSEVEEKEAACKKLKSELQSVKQKHNDELSKAATGSENLHLKLSESEKLCSKLESELHEVQTKMKSVVAEYEPKLEALKSEKSNLLSSVSSLEQEIVVLKRKLEEAESNLHSSESGQSELVNTNQSLSGKLYQLEKKLSDSESKLVKLESTVSKLTTEKDEAVNRVKCIEDEKKQLETENAALQEELEDAAKEFESLRNASDESKTGIENKVQEMSRDKEGIERRLQEMQGEVQEKDESIARLQKEEAILKQEKENLRKELDEQKKFADSESSEKYTKLVSEKEELVKRLSEAENFKSQQDSEVASLKEELSRLTSRKKNLEGNLLDCEHELSCKTEEISKLEKQVYNWNTENESLKSKLLGLEKDCDELRQQLDEQDNRSSQKDVVDESEICVSVAAGLQAPPPSTHDSNHEQLRKEFSSLESHHNETVAKMEKLMNDIEAYKRADSSNQEKLHVLERNLQEMKEKDERMSERVYELEEKEKELLEQIADIEATVIVPLEAENQELKDEISVVRQEKDEAIAKITKWGDDDDETQDLESLNKCLEDSLFQRDELEKKVNILSEDIAELEQEKEMLMKKMMDMETTENEYMEKIESLEEEVDRLHKLEQSRSVVEEAETSLMDRVLDLEEREQTLIRELEELKSKDEKTEEQMTYEDMLEKVKYLEQKNEVLQDAEGRYMDKIMELEETQHRLQSQLLESKSSSDGKTENPSASTEHAHIVSSSSVQLLTQTTVPYSYNANSGASPQQTRRSVSTETADLIQPSEQTLNLADLPPKYVRELESQNQRLTSECQEQTSKIKYLEEKLVLLQDSEARLMVKLLDSEETEGANLKVKQSSSDHDLGDLKEKIEHLTEENEFLAQNVENYKQLYKEEKEKMNDLHDRVLDDSSVLHELHEKRAELKSTQQMVEEIQSEYEEQLSEREEQEAQLNNLLAQSQQREKDLQTKLDELEKHTEDLQQKLDSVMAKEGENPQALYAWMEEEKINALHRQEVDLRHQLDRREQDLQREIQNLLEQREEQEAHHRQQVYELETQMQEVQQHQQDEQQQVDTLRQREHDLQEQVKTLGQREQDLLRQIDSLERQLQEMQERREESAHSDSGLSVDDLRARFDNTEKVSSHKKPAPEPPSIQQVYSSKVTLSLAQPAKSQAPQKPTAAGHVAESIASHDGRQSPVHSTPVAPPRRKKSRQPSIDSISHEELLFLVEELQNKEVALKKRIRDLEVFADSDLSQRVEELEAVNQSLERRLRYAESSRSSETSLSHVQESSKADSSLNNSGDTNNNNPAVAEGESALEEDTKELDRSFSSVLSSASSHTMLEKPEDVLHQRIKELESLDKHNKNQLSELERDREVLHEIARKDKATIHDLNVKIRELQLSERSLKEQVNSLEVSEGSLYSKCEDLEATKAKLEDRVHELEIHERRLRELVRKLKLDEEHWLSKSGGMETAVAELSANEMQLKRLLQDVEMEKGGLNERAEYLEARVRELENVEATLLQRLKNYENIEVSLQNRLVHLENSEAAAHSKAAELDVMNMDFSQRLQKSVEENAVLSQHVSQLRGQVQDLDRRLLSSRDSELAYKQHVESLQKNESSLQKKVREYELREIDSQARVRELEQTNDILNDKIATLQRSENRLKFRVQELEGVGGQIPGELTPEQRQKVPQKLEDCQKRVVVLQNQVENLQLQLRDALKTTHTKLASQMDEDEKVSIPVNEYSTLQTKSALLEETTYQMEEVERVNEQLNQTILQLRQGKGASGHEVEIEVLKRRLASYKTFINKLKSSLSTGQATSLWDPEQDSGPQGDTLPARHLYGLESERVLQSVRGLQDGKADTLNMGGAQQYGLTVEEDSIVQSQATSSLSSQPASADFDDDSGNSKPEQASSREESHWRAIEARKPKLVASSRGGATATVGTGAKQSPPTQRNGSKPSSTPEVEEVTIGLHLPSESELSSHYRTTQNDTDSSDNPVPPPRRGRVGRAVKSLNNNNFNNNSGNESSDGLSTDTDTPTNAAVATNKKHYFGNEKSLPSPANKESSKHEGQKQAPLNRFGEDSFYLPSSTQEGVDSLDDDEAPPLPNSGPPGAEGPIPSPWSSEGSAGNLQQERKDSLDNSTSGMSIRERIAMIEKQLQSDSLGGKADEDQVYHWKNKATESMKQVEVLEKDNKHMKEDINRLEKELEEKRRYINLLELWLSNLEDLLKNKNKQTDREMVEQLQLELSKLRSDLKHVGYRSEDAVLDPAALKTELEHRDKDIVSKRGEIDALTQELKQVRQECRSIEGMRRTALDSLRALEHEVVDLQDTERQLQEAKAELKSLRSQTEKTREVYEENLNLRDRVHHSEVELIRLRNVVDDFNNLSARYDELEEYKNQAINMIQPLQTKLERLARKCQEKDALLRRLGAELRRNTYRPSSALDDLTRLEHVMNLEEYNTDFPQMSNGPPPKRPERRSGHSRSSSMEELELHYPYSDSDSASMPVTMSKRKRPTPYVNNRPKSAETLGSGPRVQRGAHAHPRFGQEVKRSGGHLQAMGSGVNKGQFVAIADYDPALFSQSGRPRLELELKEGDHVLVTGPMDRTGYYEAEVNGRSGLVPANYLQPLHGSGHIPAYDHGDAWSSDVQLDHSPEQMVGMYRQLQQEAFNRPKDGQNTQRTGSNYQHQDGRKRSGTHSPRPDPPHNLHVKGIVNEKSILLSWLPPSLDNKGNNNGVKVLGYMVYLNNQEYEQIPSPKICEVVVEDLNPDQSHHLAVQCLCAGGYTSPRTELIFEGIVKMTQGQGNKDEDEQDRMDTDLSSVLNSAHYKRGQKKTVMALYDYNPELQSPHDYTAFELAFSAGQLIHVYGESRPDGFFHGEVDDKRGLVPACFVEEISKVTRSSQQKSATDPSTQANKGT